MKQPRRNTSARRTMAEDVAALEAAPAGAWQRAPTAKEEAAILAAQKKARAELRAKRQARACRRYRRTFGGPGCARGGQCEAFAFLGSRPARDGSGQRQPRARRAICRRC